MHHFHFGIQFGKPYITVWKLLRHKEVQTDSRHGKRLLRRVTFGIFRLEFSTYVSNL